MSGPRYSIIPGDAPYDTRLTDFDVRILACVGCHTNKSGWCSINQAKLSKRLDCSRQGVNKSITKLVELGYLDRVNRQSKSFGDKRSNLCLYRVKMDRGEAPDAVTESDELDAEPDANDAVGCQPRTTQGVNPGLQHNDLSFNDKGRRAKSQGSPAAPRGAAAISSGRPPRKKPESESPSSCGKARENRATGALRDGDLKDNRENPPAPPPAAGSQEGVQRSWTEVRAISAHPTPVADLARWLRQLDNDPEGLLSAKLTCPAHCAVLGRLIAKYGRERVISAVLDYTTGGRQPGCEIWWNGGEDRRRGHVVSWTYFEAALGERKAAA